MDCCHPRRVAAPFLHFIGCAAIEQGLVSPHAIATCKDAGEPCCATCSLQFQRAGLIAAEQLHLVATTACVAQRLRMCSRALPAGKIAVPTRVIAQPFQLRSAIGATSLGGQRLLRSSARVYAIEERWRGRDIAGRVATTEICYHCRCVGNVAGWVGPESVRTVT